MSRFYVDPDTIKNGKIHVGKEESHHILDVMRLNEGDSVTVFDGSGKEYLGKIELIKNKSAVIDIEKIEEAKSGETLFIALGQALPKKDKMDYIAQKATELGVSAIIPLETDRTIVKSGVETKERKTKRWHKIMVESAKQSGRNDLPVLKQITHFSALLPIFKEYDAVIMPCLSRETVSLKSVLTKLNNAKKILLLIGPEGDFSPREIESAKAEGAFLVSLGERVLRSDTAALATIAILNFALLNTV